MISLQDTDQKNADGNNHPATRSRIRFEPTYASKRGSTIGEGGDTTISSLERSPKQPLPGIGIHDPPHGGQVCPEFIAFDQGVGQICPR